MKRPTVIRRKPHQTVRDGLVRAAAEEHAKATLMRLQDSLRGCDRELRVETYRAVIRLTSGLIQDPMRAMGILGGAAADLAPAWTDGKTNRDQVEALFNGGKT